MSGTLLTYNSFTTDLGNVLNSGATPNITLYSDEAAETLYTDSNGNTFSEVVVATVNYTEPHNEADGTQVINGFVTVTFTDGTTVTVTDTVDTVYFVITPVAFKPRTF
jgi:hypothetical protein